MQKCMIKLVLALAASLAVAAFIAYILGSICPYVMERAPENQDARDALLGACKSMVAMIGLL